MEKKIKRRVPLRPKETIGGEATRTIAHTERVRSRELIA